MKSLTCINADDMLVEHIKEHFDVDTNIEQLSECVFIDWWPPNNVHNVEQVTALEEAIKRKCNIVVFDRYCSLKQHEVDWVLRYNNVHLFEPRLLTRNGFRYLPFWYKYEDIKIDKSLHHGAGIVKDPNRKGVLYGDLYEVNSYEDLNFTVLYGSNDEYYTGYLPDMSSILNNLCVPLLPWQHKYYGSLFQGLTVKKLDDIEFYLNMIKLNDAIIFGIYETMAHLFPEMLVENVAKEIKYTLT